MVTADAFRALALSLPHTAEKPHFDRAAFHVAIPNGLTFATLAANGASANLKLQPEEQEFVVQTEPDVFSAVKGGWGERGWTTIDLAAAVEDSARAALGLAWRNAAPTRMRRLADQVLLKKRDDT